MNQLTESEKQEKIDALVKLTKRKHMLWDELRSLAEGSDWRRDSGELMESWVIRTMKKGMSK